MTSKRVRRVALSLPFVPLVSLGLQIASFADMTVTQDVTSTVGDKKTTSTMTTCWTKTKKRTDHPGGMISITDLDSKTITVLKPKQKRYIQQSFQDAEKQEDAFPAMLREAELSVSETGEKKTIDGYPCEKLVFTVGPAEITAWITKKIAIDPAMVEFDRKFLELTKGLRGLNLKAQLQAALDKRNALPYLTIIEDHPSPNKTLRSELKVKKVSYEKIEPSVFAIPSGYEKVTLPPMPPQQ